MPAVIAVRGAREGASVVGCDVTAESAAVTVDRLEGIDKEWDAARRDTPSSSAGAGRCLPNMARMRARVRRGEGLLLDSEESQ